MIVSEMASQYPIGTPDASRCHSRTMTTPFIVEMLKRERDIQPFTTDGYRQGRISTPDVAPRLRQQVNRTEIPCVLPVAMLDRVEEDPESVCLIRAHNAR